MTNESTQPFVALVSCAGLDISLIDDAKKCADVSVQLVDVAG